MGLARSGKLGHFQLCLLADNAATLEIVGDDLIFLQGEIMRSAVPAPSLSVNSLVVYSNTDGQ